jgi:hypothetical protein
MIFYLQEQRSGKTFSIAKEYSRIPAKNQDSYIQGYAVKGDEIKITVPDNEVYPYTFLNP